MSKNKEYARAYRAAHREQILKSQRKWYQNNKEYHRKKGAEYRSDPAKRAKCNLGNVLRRYGLTEERLIIMRFLQDEKCAICQQSGQKLFVDHDHKTGAVRDLLCLQCNNMLGFARESLDTLARAKQYLEKHNVT